MQTPNPQKLVTKYTSHDYHADDGSAHLLHLPILHDTRAHTSYHALLRGASLENSHHHASFCACCDERFAFHRHGLC